ncbi:MAG TPA: nickel transporter permease [Candidatus Dormibacteraeota bacterium]|jgi:peptide/nickel transport system permease protein|nr:nickel transporter permease [Candidatus Dormibacteraeota bacterium]
MRNRAGAIGLVIVALDLVVALLAPALAPHDPLDQDVTRRLLPPVWLAGGGAEHLLGTDQLGRDILSRIIHGSRVSLLIGFLSVIVSLPVGVCVGLLAGYWSGRLDDVTMRVADVQLAFPFILLAITIAGVLGPSPRNVVLILAIGGWVVYARLARGQVLSLREKEFIEAARGLGVGTFRILFRHLLPNVASPVIVVATFAVAQMILLESSLSFLGLGVQPPTPSWGGMLNDGRAYITVAWWLSTFPGAAIMLTVLGINFVGDWLRDLLDPRLQSV